MLSYKYPLPPGRRLLSGKIKFLFLTTFSGVILLLGVPFPAAAQHEPSRPFNGVIGKTYKQSKTGTFQHPKAPSGAPNVVWIVLDDVGFGAISAFGGLIQTPHIDSLANHGLRYTNYHNTSLCSPSRAAILTGRNSHSVHMGLFPENSVELPGYDTRMPFEKATIAEILKENGYNTFATGKWHVTPVADASQAGPFNRWPTGRGFDHFYGFLFGETNQYHPQLWENNLKVETDTKGKVVQTLFSDKAIQYIAGQKSFDPDKPFFLYYTTSATHEPIQVDRYWSDLYKGKFDDGWDKYSEVVLENQKQLGLIPKNAKLPLPNPNAKPWKSYSAEERKALARLMEVYAGFVTHADHEIGRVVDYLKQIDQLENTAIFVVVGDNGACRNAGESGYVSGYSDSEQDEGNMAQLLKDYKIAGEEHSFTQYPKQWAAATNTPFRLWKADAHGEGGTHNPLIVFYPKKIKKAGIRNQYLHGIDLLPTTIKLTNANVPASINGYPQDSIEGYSFFESIENANAVSKHTVQYYESAGNRAIYKDGWKASAGHRGGRPFDQDTWQLFHIAEDFNERIDLAVKNPAKLKELQQVFDQEAEKYQVYPLKDWADKNWDDWNNVYGRNKVVLYPEAPQLYGHIGPVLHNKSFSITADAEITNQTEGVLFAYGGYFDGLSLFIQNGKLQAAINNSNYDFTIRRDALISDSPVPTGRLQLRLDFDYTNPEGTEAHAGYIRLYINDKKTAEFPIRKFQANLHTGDDGIDVGRDLNTPVSSNYKVPFEFTGKLYSVTVETK